MTSSTSSSETPAAAATRVFTPRQQLLKAIGPGILMAGAAIGGSHLVSSTQAGAKYGWSLLVLLLLANLFKYPFFLYGERYTAATGETILHGIRRMGKGFVGAYFLLNLVNAFLNIAGVAMITASLSINLGANRLGMPLAELTFSIAVVCAMIIIVGRYRLLDSIAKVVMVLLAASTLTAAAYEGVTVRECARGHGHSAPGDQFAVPIGGARVLTHASSPASSRHRSQARQIRL
jgi:Mn2+/Fe2+ NRAMP family transporter